MLAAAIAALFSCAPPPLARTDDDCEFEEARAGPFAGGGKGRDDECRGMDDAPVLGYRAL